LDFSKRTIIAMCGDNGIVAEGISQSTQEVTLAVTKAMGRQASSVGKMGAVNGTRVLPVDVGVATPEDIPGVWNKKVALGTKNFLQEPAMTEAQTYQAMEVGMEAVAKCKQEGCQLIGTGEMGIGNTTTSSAMVAALLHLPVEMVTGRGAGLDDAGLQRKKQVISQALEQYGFSPDTEEKGSLCRNPQQAFAILQCVGGLDIAGLVGVMLGGAYYHVPIVLDGVISLAAALAAVAMVPEVRDYLFPSHAGREPAAKCILEALKMQPVISADLALGEGTGAVLLFSMLDAVMALYDAGSTFADIDIAAYERF
jgi:nicotinate-nucleotide--dimethylbenzimidazole phosphoribosyltransferase